MTKVLILEGNTPELLQPREAMGIPWTAEAYGAALRVFAPALEIDIVRPYFPDFDPDAVEIDGIDGMAVTGSGVSWNGADAWARPFWRLYERAFAAGKPVLGCCWGLHLGAVVLGGDTAAGPNGVEAGFARDVELTEAGKAHPLHAGRSGTFDVAAMHRDDVTRLPDSAVITASNAHTQVQGMVYEQGATRFWGVQYHPELTLADIAYFFTRPSTADPGELARRAEAAADFRRILDDPAASGDLRARHGIDDAILNFEIHAVELRNWLTHCLGIEAGAAKEEIA